MIYEQATRAIQEATLYGILDTGYSNPEDWPDLARKLIRGGVGVLQVRAKDLEPTEILKWAQPVVPLAHELGCPVIINDFPELVQPLGAAGVHVGQDDLTVSEAKEQSDISCVIGKSTHSLEQARQAQTDKADYIGFGPIFTTPTKPGRPAIGPELITQMSHEISIPAFCIGGIKKENVSELKARGAERVVIVSGLLQSSDPTTYAKEVIRSL
ncbi:MAG: thiamine phosphate synthase [Verrucomicrobiota bacterium]